MFRAVSVETKPHLYFAHMEPAIHFNLKSLKIIADERSINYSRGIIAKIRSPDDP